MSDKNEVAQVNESQSMVSVIQQVALNPDVPVDKLERMLDMQERIFDRQAKQDFAAAMVRVQSAIPAIRKGCFNQQTSSSYADLDYINSIITPIYTAEGFALSFNTIGQRIENTVCVACEVSHIGGHSKEYTYDSPIDDKGIKGTVNKTETHGRASANTYAKRYLTNMIFNITLTDSDNDGNADYFDGDVAVAFQEASSKQVLRSIWASLSPAQQKQHRNDLDVRLGEL